MKRLGLVMLAIGLIAAAPAFADEWSKTYQLSGKPDLRVDTSDANIRLSTWDQNTIEAKVLTTRDKIGDDGIQVEERQSGDRVEIEVHHPRRNGHFHVEWGNHRVDVIIHMPREGRINLRTGDGNVEVVGLKGEMELHTGDGNVSLDGIDGNLRAGTGDGNIRGSGRFDALELKTGDGQVEVRAANGSSIASAWRLETGDGNVTLEVPGDMAADVDLHTSDGHIDLEVPVTTAGQVRENEVRGKLNGGGSLLTIRSGDGSIHLRKG